MRRVDELDRLTGGERDGPPELGGDTRVAEPRIHAAGARREVADNGENGLLSGGGASAALGHWRLLYRPLRPHDQWASVAGGRRREDDGTYLARRTPFLPWSSYGPFPHPRLLLEPRTVKDLDRRVHDERPDVRPT